MNEGSPASGGRTEGSPASGGRTDRIALAAAGIALLVAYAPALAAGWIWDDDRYVTANPMLHSLEGLWLIWTDRRATIQYYPLVHTTYWLEARLWGASPFGHHLDNVLLHAASSWLLWRLLRRLGVPGAAWGAALFAFHPVMVESVAWVTERKNALSVLLSLGALHLWLAWRPLDGGRPGGAGAWAAMFALFIGALLSKTVACTLPAAMLVIVWWKRGRIGVADVAPLLPLFAVGAALGLQTAWLETHQVGARGPDWDLSPADRVLVAGRAVWFYLGKLLWPHPLLFIYPRWEIDAGAPWQWIFPAAALGLVIALWLARGRIGRGPLAAALLFGGTLFPALGFFDVYPMRFSFVADHFQYAASIAPLALLGAGMGWAARRWNRRATTAAGLAVVGALAFLTHQQTRIYRDAETLWRSVLAGNPAAGIAHNNLGSILLRRGEVDAAAGHFEEAIRVHETLDQAHNNLGIVFQQRRRPREAEAAYARAIELAPRSARPHANLGALLARRGDLERAERHLRLAIEAQPYDADSRTNLGIVLARSGRLDEALAQLREAVRLKPDDAALRRNLDEVSRLAGSG